MNNANLGNKIFPESWDTEENVKVVQKELQSALEQTQFKIASSCSNSLRV